MRAVILAAGSTALTFPAASEDMTPAFIGCAVVDMLDAHGAKGGRFASAEAYDDEFEGVIIKDLSAGRPGRFSVRAGSLVVGPVREPTGDGAQWLGISQIAATDVTVDFEGKTLKLPKLEISDLELLNSVTDAEAEANGYEFIDGAFSAVTMSSLKAGDASLAEGGKVASDGIAVNLKLSEWLPNLAFPARAALSVSGFLTPETVAEIRRAEAGGKPEEFAFVGDYGLTRSIGLGTVQASLRTATLGAASAKVGLSGLKAGKVSQIADELRDIGEDGLPKLLAGVPLSAAAASGEGLGWLRGATRFDRAAAELGMARFLVPSAARAGAEFLDAVLSERKTVARIAPTGRLPLSGLVAGTAHPVGDAIPVTR